MDISKFINVAKFKPMLASLNIFSTHICATGLFSSLFIGTSTLNFLLSLWTCLPWKSRLWFHHELGQGVLVFPLYEWLWVAWEYKFPQWCFFIEKVHVIGSISEYIVELHKKFSLLGFKYMSKNFYMSENI